MRVLSLLFLAGLLAGCSDERDITLGDFAREIAEPWCERARVCFPDTFPSQQECVNELVSFVCADADCSREATVSQGELDACYDDIPSLTCTEIESGIFPASCQGIEESMV